MYLLCCYKQRFLKYEIGFQCFQVNSKLSISQKQVLKNTYLDHSPGFLTLFTDDQLFLKQGLYFHSKSKSIQISTFGNVYQRRSINVFYRFRSQLISGTSAIKTIHLNSIEHHQRRNRRHQHLPFFSRLVEFYLLVSLAFSINKYYTKYH